jgi:hypothetical protein
MRLTSRSSYYYYDDDLRPRPQEQQRLLQRDPRERVTMANLRSLYCATILVLPFVTIFLLPLPVTSFLTFPYLHVGRVRTTTSFDMFQIKFSQDNDPTENEPDAMTNNTSSLSTKTKKNPGLKRLAELSLQDYQWRINVWKSNQADRQIEQSLARLMGQENSWYIRPMDASEASIGPLGLWERSCVEWLSQVLEEEARRAEQIVRLGGILVRPMDQLSQPQQQSGEVPSDTPELGPLGMLELRLVHFLESIRQSEQERYKTSLLTRPKDMEASKRGPLGEAELKATDAIREWFQSESIRARLQSKLPKGVVVRPIDVPGPLGEFEMAVLQVVQAEEQRRAQYEELIRQEQTLTNKDRTSFGSKVNTSLWSIRSPPLLRPMNAQYPGPLGELEQQATEFVEKLTLEEKQRLHNLQRYLEDHRPMNQLHDDRNNNAFFWGILETMLVGIVRAPILLYQIVKRVQTILESEPLDQADAEILFQRQIQQQLDKDK